MSAAGRPPPGAPLAEHTAWHRKRHEEHLSSEEQSRTGLLGRRKRPSFRPIPLAELAPTIRQRNDAAAQRELDQEMRANAAREILLVCDLIRKACDGGGDLDPEGVKTFADAVAEMCAMLIEPARSGSPRDDDRRAAMHEAIASLTRTLGR